MNFFEQQDRARQNTRSLILLFSLAVLTKIVIVYLIFASFWSKSGRGWWYEDLFIFVAGGMIAIIGLGTIYKSFRLRAGGAVIAEQLGGRLLLSDTATPQQQQLLNVVSEMAIAAGIAVPSVYLLKYEREINAFAAGHTPNSAVIGVTQGALSRLTRGELQAVIAHEFSHILNGDMRLNTRLIAILHGILCLSLIGQYALLSVKRDDSKDGKDSYKDSYKDSHKDSYSYKDDYGDGGGTSWIVTIFGIGPVLVGLGFMLIGGIGVFFGSLIKSAVSRQREFLADASAVQFTRNPAELASALEKIAEFGSNIHSPHAATLSHLFFGSALTFGWFESWFATHPSLPKRIQKII